MPDVARGVFGERLHLAEAYAALLATDGVTRGVIGPREAPRMWDRHLLNCAVVTDVLDVGAEVCDVGSGAGLPGVVLAIRRPDLRVTLVEPLLRRTTFLTEVADRLSLDNVNVVRARAEALHGVRDFDAVTARAVAPLPRLLAWCLPLARPGGVVVAVKGSSAGEEVAAAGDLLRRHRVGPVDTLTLGIDVIDPPTTVVRVGSTASARLGWGAGRPAERPRGRRRGR